MAMATCPSKSFSDQTSRRSPQAPRFMALMADRKDAPKALQLYLYTLLRPFAGAIEEKLGVTKA